MMRDSLAIQLTTYETLNVATSVDQVVTLRGPMSDAAVMYQQSSKILLDAAGLAVGSAAILLELVQQSSSTAFAEPSARIPT